MQCKTIFVFLYFRLSRSSVVYLLCDFELPPSKVTPCWQTSCQTLAFTQIYISVLLRTFLTCSHVSYMSTITYFLSCLYCFLNAHISSYGLCSTFFSFLSLLLSLSPWGYYKCLEEVISLLPTTFNQGLMKR